MLDLLNPEEIQKIGDTFELVRYPPGTVFLSEEETINYIGIKILKGIRSALSLTLKHAIDQIVVLSE